MSGETIRGECVDGSEATPDPTGLDTSNGLEFVQQRIGLFANNSCSWGAVA